MVYKRQIKQKYLSNEHKLFFRGHRKGTKNKFLKLLTGSFDYIKLIFVLFFNDIQIVHFNTSLDYVSLIRDFFFIKIAKIFRKKILVYFHGWHKEGREALNAGKLEYIKRTFFSADLFIVLSKEFRNDLQNWGYKKNILVEKNLIDESELSLVSPQVISLKFNFPDKIFNILFISRIEKEKGIFEALESFQLFNLKYPNSKLIIAGDGSQKFSIEQLIREKRLQSKITMKGIITGKEKSSCLLDADVLLFPTYGEGMPMNVIEAMSFGLPIITRPVGGIKDFFINGEMGFLINSIDPAEFFRYLELIYLNIEVRKRISIENYYYSKRTFYSNIVIERFCNIYKSLV